MRLVERYLFYFVQITHHGSYIDGFAGPQRLTTPENWCAKRVIESEPKWLRHFFLCELKPESFGALEKLRDEQQPIGKGKWLVLTIAPYTRRKRRSNWTFLYRRKQALLSFILQVY